MNISIYNRHFSSFSHFLPSVLGKVLLECEVQRDLFGSDDLLLKSVRPFGKDSHVTGFHLHGKVRFIDPFTFLIFN